MGAFAKKVRHNKIPGPNQRGFNRAEWEARQNDVSFDDDDLRLFEAGLFFDELLCFLRDQKKLSEIPLSAEAIIRFMIAIGTSNLFQIHENTKIDPKNGNADKSVNMAEIMQLTVELATGQHFSPDELISGIGDGMKHILRELLPPKNEPGNLSEYESNEEAVEKVYREFNFAIIYQCAVEYWNDCVGHSYGLKKNEHGIMLIPSDETLEIATIVSSYRRHKMTLFDMMMVLDHWTHKWDRPAKEKMCEIPLVSRIYGRDRIENIELGMNAKLLADAAPTVAAKLWLKHTYYKHLLDEPLPNFSGFTLNKILLGWQLLQSLSCAIFDSFTPVETNDAKSILRFAPRIAKRTLIGAFSKALKLTHQESTQLIDVFTFHPPNSKEVWCHPLVSLQDDYCLVVPCIHAVQPLRIIEGWMREGGLDLDRRGPEFEKFCREDIALSLSKSAIRRHVTLIDRDVTFKPASEREEEIDIIIIIGKTILLIEAKCILWPDESLQYANYRDTVEGAIEQIIRKKDAVVRNYECFSDKLKQLGYSAPEACSIECCVLTNSAVYSGFPIDGVPVVDLSILGTFFDNNFTKFEARQSGKTTSSFSISFYTDIDDAEDKLNGYLLDPPQLIDTKKSVKSRQTTFPIEHSTFGKLIKQSYSVQIDLDEMKKRYEIGDDL